MEDQYLIYLRKSRKDVEAEQQGEGETLARHRKILFDLAKARNYTVANVYEEIVSGDSLAARPKMQELLRAVETGAYSGVLVVELERLSRGDTIDQAIILRTFQYTDTKIITPIKTYDPTDEMDKEFFELGLFMSRHEYNTIKRRLRRGKELAAQEGKWSNGFAPYGYEKQKLKNQKGYTLQPDENADTVRMIFSLYCGGDGMQKIAGKLNLLGIQTPSGKGNWQLDNVRNIISNPVYAGNIRTNARHYETKFSNGEIVKTHPRTKSQDVQIVPGLHEPIVSQKMWDDANEILSKRGLPIAADKELKNPFAKLLRCSACGHILVATGFNQRYHGFLQCTHCKSNVGAKVEDVENAVLEALIEWAADFSCDFGDDAGQSEKQDALAKTIERSRRELKKIEAQKLKAYELVEREIYDIRTFQDRMAKLSAQEESLLADIKSAQDASEALTTAEKTKKELLPNIRKVLEAYPFAKNAQEKNDLLRSVLAKIDYSKTRTAQSKEGSDMTLILYPLISDK